MPLRKLSTALNRKTLTTGLLATALLVLSGCCPKGATQQDPFEQSNRDSYKFNDVLDSLILSPVARTYKTLTPMPLQVGVSNAYDNIREPSTVINDVLQFKPTFALSDLGRFVINSTFGVLGFFDVATRLGLPPHQNDFGITLVNWSGTDNTTYLVLPVLGPSTLGGAFAKPFDYYSNPLHHIGSRKDQMRLYAGSVVDRRTRFLDADRMISTAFDPYVFVRSYYMNYRNRLIRESHLSYAAFKKQYYQKHPRP